MIREVLQPREICVATRPFRGSQAHDSHPGMLSQRGRDSTTSGPPSSVRPDRQRLCLATCRKSPECNSIVAVAITTHRVPGDRTQTSVPGNESGGLLAVDVCPLPSAPCLLLPTSLVVPSAAAQIRMCLLSPSAVDKLSSLVGLVYDNAISGSELK